jgi:hypothetical protein
MLNAKRKQRAGQAYATRTDFCRVFKDEMGPLYLLAFLLTANHADAEKCFLAALADARKEPVVFKEFAASWSRRCVIAQAIRLAAPGSSRKSETSDRWGNDEGDSSNVINRVAQLRSLERFVFVLTVLERYRDVECAILLGRTRAGVTQARRCALETIARATPRPTVLKEQQALNHRDECAACAPPPAA